MTLVARFEDLEIWKIAREIVNNINNDFKNTRDFSFKDQIYSAGFSIMNNISEAYLQVGRVLEGNQKQNFIGFLISLKDLVMRLRTCTTLQKI